MTFATEMHKNWRAALPALMFGRFNLRNFVETDRYGVANVGHDSWSVVEGVINNTGGDIVHGCPMIRCKMSGNGADEVVYNTMVTGGADAGTSTDGCFLNFAGISAFQTKDEAALAQRQIFLHFPDLTVAPAAGATITQAVTGATGIVIASSIVYNYVLVLDTSATGVVWDTTNTCADSGLTMVPATPIPRNIVYGTLDANGNFEGNGDCYQNGAGIWVIVRGYALGFVQGDDSAAGAGGYNGDIADCTALTWNDDVVALVCAAHQVAVDAAGSTVDVYVNADNVIAHAMQAAGDNSGHTPEIILMYVRADEPLVFAASACQGVDPSIQRPE